MRYLILDYLVQCRNYFVARQFGVNTLATKFQNDVGEFHHFISFFIQRLAVIYL